MENKEKKLYSDRRWTEPIACRVIGYEEVTEEEKEMVRQFKERWKKRQEEANK